MTIDHDAGPAVGTLCDVSDADTLARLYRRTERAAHAKTAALTGNFQAAEEIVQDVFSRLWRSKIRFPSEKAGFLWIYRSCHRAGIDYLRSGRFRFEAQGLEGCTDIATNDEEAMIHNRKALLACISKLDVRECEILAYIYLDGMNQQEVADLLGVSRKTIQRSFDRIETKLAEFKEGR